jgi:hypothetical protein
MEIIIQILAFVVIAGIMLLVLKMMMDGSLKAWNKEEAFKERMKLVMKFNEERQAKIRASRHRRWTNRKAIRRRKR